MDAVGPLNLLLYHGVFSGEASTFPQKSIIVFSVPSQLSFPRDIPPPMQRTGDGNSSSKFSVLGEDQHLFQSEYWPCLPENLGSAVSSGNRIRKEALPQVLWFTLPSKFHSESFLFFCLAPALN